MQLKKIVRDETTQAWRFLSVYSAFRRRHKSIYEKTSFEKYSLTDSEKKEYINYWKRVSPLVNLKTVELSKSLSGMFDKKIIPEEIFTLYIEPTLNDNKDVNFLANKSIYNKWFDEGIFPKDFFHKIDNNYYTDDFKTIENIDDFINNQINDIDFPIVIKPNKDSYGGKDIYFVNSKDDIKKTIQRHSNLVVQEKLQQSDLINTFNKDSINTVRACLYKDKTGAVHLLNASIRMGKDGSLDNESDGGIVCNIKPTGSLNDYAVNKYAEKYFSHPNSGFVFADKQFPLYKSLIEVSQNVAKDIIDASLISLDMALDANDKWRCIEINLFGQTIRFAQYAGEPFLGEYTDEIIDELLK